MKKRLFLILIAVVMAVGIACKDPDDKGKDKGNEPPEPVVMTQQDIIDKIQKAAELAEGDVYSHSDFDIRFGGTGFLSDNYIRVIGMGGNIPFTTTALDGEYNYLGVDTQTDLFYSTYSASVNGMFEDMLDGTDLSEIVGLPFALGENSYMGGHSWLGYFGQGEAGMYFLSGGSDSEIPGILFPLDYGTVEEDSITNITHTDNADGSQIIKFSVKPEYFEAPSSEEKPVFVITAVKIELHFDAEGRLSKEVITVDIDYKTYTEGSPTVVTMKLKLNDTTINKKCVTIDDCSGYEPAAAALSLIDDEIRSGTPVREIEQLAHLFAYPE